MICVYRGLFWWHVFDTRKIWFFLHPHPRFYCKSDALRCAHMSPQACDEHLRGA